MLRLGLLLLLGACQPAVAERVFRCTIDGKVTFQQQACAEGGGAVAVQPGNVIAAPRQAKPAPAAATGRPVPAAPAGKSALDEEAERCLDYLRPLLRDPRSAYASAASREGRVLSLTVHAANSLGGIATRRAACEFFNGVIDKGWTKIHLERLGWFQPRIAGQARQAGGEGVGDAEAHLNASLPSAMLSRSFNA